MIVENVTIRDGHLGIAGKRVKLINTVIRDNDFAGVRANNILAIGSSIIDNSGHEGLAARKTRLIDTLVTGSGLVGVEADKLRADGSQIVGNGTEPGCGVTDLCVDVATYKRPRLFNSTCGTSLDEKGCDCTPFDPFVEGEADPAAHNHGVCTLD